MSNNNPMNNKPVTVHSKHITLRDSNQNSRIQPANCILNPSDPGIATAIGLDNANTQHLNAAGKLENVGVEIGRVVDEDEKSAVRGR